MDRTAAIALIVSAAFLLWVLFGYPLFLGALASFRAKPVRRLYRPRTVSVILPVANGEQWIEAKLKSIQALRYPRELMQILVVSDGSTDGTDAIAGGWADRGVELVRVGKGGKARALNAGIERARGEILFFTDVRQSLDATALRRLVECFEDPAVGVASGELIIRKGETTGEADIGLYWRYEKWIRKQQSRLDSVPGATGSIYAMRRPLARPLSEGALNDDMMLPLAAFLEGYRIIFDQEARAYDYPTALEAEFHRKVRTLAGVYQVIAAYPALLGPRNRIWIHFVSHKLGRLLLPHALLAIAVSSFFLPGAWAAALLAGQAAFYGLAALGPGAGGPLHRPASLARTFVVLMAAAFCAQSYFFGGGARLWKTTEVRGGRPGPRSR